MNGECTGLGEVAAQRVHMGVGWSISRQVPGGYAPLFEERVVSGVPRPIQPHDTRVGAKAWHRNVGVARFGVFSRQATMEYGGGITTVVGYESIATPGGIAGLGEAWRGWGVVPWREVLAPAVALARAGLPLSEASHFYLGYSHDLVFGWHPTSYASLHDANGRLLPAGSLITVPGLADTIAELGDRGAGDFYRGEIAQVLADDVADGGSLVSAEDLARYEPAIQPALRSQIGRWEVYTNPPPSIGGVTLTAMLELATQKGDHSPDVDALITSQAAVLGYRREYLDRAPDLEAATRDLLDRLVDGDELEWMSSPSTVHASSVDEDGAACSITMSAGYGSGVVAGSTGMWMNNSLGEAELNRRGFHDLPIGMRLPSNMAPTIALRDDGAVLSLGSPGADRITTALQQVLVAIAGGNGLQEAVDAPRLHVELGDDAMTVAYEAGLVMPSGLTTRPFDTPHMFFGGVAAALLEPQHGLSAASDGRRAGGMAMS